MTSNSEKPESNTSEEAAPPAETSTTTQETVETSESAPDNNISATENTDESKNESLADLTDANPIHEILLEVGKSSLEEVYKNFAFTDTAIEVVPSKQKSALHPHNAYFYMNANKMNAFVCISESKEALENTAKKILGETSVTEKDAIDAAQELTNILYGSFKKRMQHQGFTFGLANYQYAQYKPGESLFDEDVRYGFDFNVVSDLGDIVVKLMYDTVEFKTEKKEKEKSSVNSTYLEGYLAVKLGDFSTDKAINFDIFLHLRLNNRVILYKRGGSTISEEVMNRFKSFHIETFYIKEEDNSKFIEYISKKAAEILTDKKLTQKEKQEKTEVIAQNLMSGFFEDPDNAEQYLNSAHEVVNRVVDEILSDSDPIKNLFKRLQTQLKTMEAHSCNVQAMSTVMAMALGYTSDKALASVAMGSMFHDIGYSKLPKELQNKDEDELTPEQLKELRKHPDLGVEVIENSATAFTYETKLIVQQHHERHDGSGYPQKLKGFQTFELSKIVAMADELDYRIRKNPKKTNDVIVKDWWKELNSAETKKHDLALFKRVFSKLAPKAFAGM